MPPKDKVFSDDLEAEIERLSSQGYDLKRAIINLKEGGKFESPPPVYGAFTRLDLWEERRLEQAYEIVTGTK